MAKRIAVYGIKHDTSGKVYVGSSGDIDARLQRHKHDLKTGTHVNKNLQVLHDQDPNFTVIVCEVFDRERAFDIEQNMLNENFASGLLLNTATDARSSAKGRSPSTYTIQRIKEANTGRTISDQQKQQISQANKGRTLTEDHKLRISEANKEKVITEEFRERMANILKGNTRSNKKVLVNGVEYPSAKEAALSLNIPYPTAKGRLRSDSEIFKDWTYIK